MDVRAAEILDLRGLKCPLPALLAKRALWRAAAGSTLTVVADDPLAHIDIPHMCREQNFIVLSSERDGDCVRLSLQKPALP